MACNIESMKTQTEIVEMIETYRPGFAASFAAFDAAVQTVPGADVAAKAIAALVQGGYKLDMLDPLCADKGSWADDYSFDFRDGSRATYNYKYGWMHFSATGECSRVR